MLGRGTSRGHCVVASCCSASTSPGARACCARIDGRHSLRGQRRGSAEFGHLSGWLQWLFSPLVVISLVQGPDGTAPASTNRHDTTSESPSSDAYPKQPLSAGLTSRPAAL